MKDYSGLLPAIAILTSLFCHPLSSQAADETTLGIFSKQTDVGDCSKPGAVEFNSKTG